LKLSVASWRAPAVLFLFVLGPLTQRASAQLDLAGQWAALQHEDQPERASGPEIGDYTGIPINDADRLRGDSWDAQLADVIEHQCEQHPADYGATNLRIYSDADPLTQAITAWHTVMQHNTAQRIIYMDGRPHPPEYAPFMRQGFSTGEWVADMLRVTMTHLKEGYLRKNGLTRSDKAVVTEYYVRHHQYLVVARIIDDPVYLTEPFIRSYNWVLDENIHLAPNYCIPSELVARPAGWVPHHLPGTNRYLTEFASRWRVPVEATRGGAESMYPEYQQKLAAMPAPPEYAEYKESLEKSSSSPAAPDTK
jgi:hypothetical protein